MCCYVVKPVFSAQLLEFNNTFTRVTIPVRVKCNQRLLSMLTQSSVALVVLHCPKKDNQEVLGKIHKHTSRVHNANIT